VESLKSFVLFYAHHLYLVDYVLILFVFFLFTSILLLCLFLRQYPFLALLIIAFDIVLCFFVYFYAYGFIDNQIRKREISVIEQRIIQSSGALVVNFELRNNSKRLFKDCKITAKIFKNPTSQESFLNFYKAKYLALRKKSIHLKNVKKNSSQIQRIAFENFNVEGNYSLKMHSECF